ncbi:glucose-1-phosphate thymidylyltransferase [Streptomyces sp. NRRL F-5053]|uniref:glucose-1-phosphate thymidylyltransferase n=1 Tax=Streptomyces sp. NRRL F-5053 TaxID=1463854 RepID=UPI0004CA2B8B|nr:glucose-1-phosphate thymidylyltransferase [Streptomyces sp. NRRL F-5053]
MKALVLAGGSGTRLRPITHTRAKQLVPVANKPVLFYGLESIRNAGITEVGLVVGDTAPAIEEAVGDGSAFGLQVTYLRQEAPLGLAHAVRIARGYLGDEPFVMYLGDNFLVGGITELVRSFDPAVHDALVLLTPVPDPEMFGVAEVRAGRVVRLVEKPAEPPSDLALVGVYLFSSAVHEAAAEIKPSWRGELEITDAIQWLIDRGRPVASTTVEGYWKDTGDVESILEVNGRLLERRGDETAVHGDVDAVSELTGGVRVAAGARIRRSRIAGPVDIAAGTLIEDCSIGPWTSIGEGCRLRGSGLRRSIVLAHASIAGAHGIESSLIGHCAEIASDGDRGAPRRTLVLGDHSKVRI